MQVHQFPKIPSIHVTVEKKFLFYFFACLWKNSGSGSVQKITDPENCTKSLQWVFHCSTEPGIHKHCVGKISIRASYLTLPFLPGHRLQAIQDIRLLCSLLERNPVLLQDHKAQLHTLLGELAMMKQMKADRVRIRIPHWIAFNFGPEPI